MAGPSVGPFRARLKCIDPSKKPKCNQVKQKLFEKLKVCLTQLIEQKFGSIAVASKCADIEMLLSKEAESTLNQLNLKPVTPPKVRAQRTIVFKRCDQSILSYSEEEIKDDLLRSRNQNNWMKINKVIKFHNSKSSFKIEFGDTSVAEKVLNEGIYLFHLHVPSYNCEKEFYYEIKTCFKCYELENHITPHCKKSTDYIVCSECSQLGHKFFQCPNRETPRCLNCDGEHGATSMKCPKRKLIIKQKLKESKQSFSEAIKQGKTNDNTPVHPQSFELMTILMTAHIHNAAYPGEFNKEANRLLKSNGMKEMIFPSNPNSNGILYNINRSNPNQIPAAAITMKANPGSQNNNNKKKPKKKNTNKSEDKDMETEITPINKDNEPRKLMKRTASDPLLETVKKSKTNELDEFDECDPNISLYNRFEIPKFTYLRNPSKKNGSK